MVCLWLWVFWVKTTELKCPSCYMVRRTCSVHIDLDRRATALFFSFLRCEVSLPALLSKLYSLEGCHK